MSANRFAASAGTLTGLTSPRSAVLVIILVTAILRLGFGAVGGLGVDESYMVSNARELAFSYVDDPPLHIWLVGLWARLWGSEAPLLVRLPFIALFAGSSWLMFGMTQRLFGARAGLWAVIAFNLAPVFGVTSGTYVLPDGPLIFFLLAGGDVLTRILFATGSERSQLGLWLLAGLFGGLAFLSKLHGAFFFLATLAFLVTVPAERWRLATAGPWLGAALAVLILVPVIVWNLQNHFVGLTFQAKRLDYAGGLSVLRPVGNLGLQAVYLGIWTFVPAAYALIRGLAAGPSVPRSWLMALLAVGPIAFFTLATLRAPGLPHWEMPGWLFALPLAGRQLAAWEDAWPRLVRRVTAAVAALVVVLVAAMAMHVESGWLTRLFPRAMGAVDLIDWTALRSALADRGLLGPDAVVGAPFWTQAGKVSYALGPQVPVICLCDDQQQFAYRDNLAEFAGRDVVVVVRRDGERTLDDVRPFFDSVEVLDRPVEVRRPNGALALTLDIAIGHSLRPPR